ncbi:MAG: hypothetical protein U1F56_00310 [Rubrivivax sp.]
MRRRTLAIALCGCAGPLRLHAQPAAPVRIRGTVVAVTDDRLTVKDRSGEVIQLLTPAALVINELYPIAMADIRPGSFIGTAATTQPDGTRRAVGVMVFPEAMRGTGEGDRPFDLGPQSTMTNATVSELVAVPSGRTLRLKHKDGEAAIVVPDDAPVVTLRRADRSLLVPGASVSLTAQLVDGRPTVLRLSAGRNGFVLPY